MENFKKALRDSSEITGLTFLALLTLLLPELFALLRYLLSISVTPVERVSFFIVFSVISVFVVALFSLAAILPYYALSLSGTVRFAQMIYMLLLTSLFAALWQNSLMHGDGIRSHPYFDYIHIAGLVLVPLLLVLWVYLLAFFRHPSGLVRRGISLVVGLTGWVAGHYLLPNYVEFHGFLFLFVLASVVWALYPFFYGRLSPFVAPVIALVWLLLVPLVPHWDLLQRHLQGVSQVVPSLLRLPLVSSFELPPNNPLVIDTPVTDADLENMRQTLSRRHRNSGKQVRGKNVVFIVLEATRADIWDDSNVTPGFHRWKSHGLYFRDALAQYPATPLAYGAMLTSQSPAVLTQTSAWAKKRVFDELAPSFDTLILTRPNVSWFGRSAITNFFVSPKNRSLVNKHKNTHDALEYLQSKIKKAKGGSFFAWAHLYEPHQPWVAHKEFMRGKGSVAKYCSEVAYVDHELEVFMKWFYQQDFSKNTLLMVSADHGEGLGEIVEGKRFKGHHVHVYNFISHVPAFFSGPGVPAGVANDFTVQQIDIMPTVFDFLGIRAPAKLMMQGRSLYDLLQTRVKRDFVTMAFSIRGGAFFKMIEQARNRRSAELRKKFRKISTQGSYPPRIALQYGDDKIIKNLLSEKLMLFDIKNDSLEQHDIVVKKTDIARRLLSRLAAWARMQTLIVEAFNQEDERKPDI